MAHLKPTSRFAPAPAVWAIVFALPLLSAIGARAATLQLRDGTILTGRLGKTAGVAEDPFQPGPSAGEIRTTPLLVIDDGLRRTFVHKAVVREVLDEADPQSIRVRVWQNHADRGASLGVVGAPVRVTPFDEFGRRIIELPTGDGTISVVQGITEITPVYTRVRGLRTKPKSYIWDMRLATSSIPRDELARVVAHATPRDDLDARLQVVRLYLQSERYRDARRELERVREDFADQPEVESFDQEIQTLRKLAANRLLEEIELRRGAGQHALTRALLERFPAEDVAGDTLQRVRELLDRDDERSAQRDELVEFLNEKVEKLDDPAAREIGGRIAEEVARRLGPATMDRLTPFRQLRRGDALSAEELTAVAISGWLMGPDRANDNLPEALSLVGVRDMVRQYLIETQPEVRDSLLLEIRDSQGATVERVADLLKRIEPPLSLPDSQVGPRCYETYSESGFRCLIQLPPEYDPLGSYPAILTLPPIGGTADRQVDYWAGAPRGEQGRIGQAMRRGYVVISVEWAAENQLAYGYTPQEHAAVLGALRDAMRRVAIDPDRIYLSGHGNGGDLAWDLALAHPDAWAGVVPLLARADRYCGWYWPNAEHVPWRMVCGELDAGKLRLNAREFDRYLKPRYDATVVEYRGRGYDPLSDEIQRAFDWMGRKRRAAPPEEFECVTMRPWDNYFWWIEAQGLPEKSMVAPAAWPPEKGVRAATIRGRKYTGNKVGVNARVDKLTVWLSPELVDFDEPIEVQWNGRRITTRGELVEPSLYVLLEDARTRADRQRPYWAKVESR